MNSPGQLPTISLWQENCRIPFLPELTKFWVVLLTAVTFYVLAFPFLQTLGFPADDAAQHIGEFLKTTGYHRTNSIFLYMSGCIFFMIVVLVYDRFIFAKIREDSTLYVEAICSLGFLLISLFLIDDLYVRLLVGLGRILVSSGLWLGLLPSESSPRVNKRRSFIFYVGLLIVGGWFMADKALCPIDFNFSTKGILFGLIVGLILFGLLSLEEKFPRWLKLCWDGIVFLAIANLSLSNDVHYFDQTHFVIPANEISLGKDILANVIAQYGFGSLYFLAGLFKIFPQVDKYMLLSIVNSLFYILGYSFVYVWLRSYTQRPIFSSVALLCVFVVNFYLLTNIPVHWTPSVGFLRIGVFFLVFCLLYSERLRNLKCWEWLVAVCVVCSSLWVIDFGVYVFVSFAGAAICQFFWGRGTPQRWQLLRVLLKVIGLLSGVIAGLSIYILFKYGHGPAWQDLIHYHRFYVQKGVSVLQLNHFILWPLVVFVYFSMIFISLSAYRQLKSPAAWLYLSFFGLTSLLYYIAQGLMDHLARVVLPMTMLFSLSWGFVIKRDFIVRVCSFNIRLKYFVYGICLIFALVLLGSVARFAEGRTLGQYLRYNLSDFIQNGRTDSLAKFMPKNRIQGFRYDVLTIQKMIPPGEPLIILSRNDSLYHVYAERKSLFKIAFYPTFNYLAPDISGPVEQILKSDARYLFIDATRYQCYNNKVTEHFEPMRAALIPYFKKKNSFGLLDLYERVK